MYGSYLKYGFISTGDSEAPYPLCPICNSKLSNKVMRHSKLLRHMKTKHAKLEDKSLEFFERRKRDREVEKRLLRTVVSTNLNALRCLTASLRLISHLLLVKNQFYLHALDICGEVFGESVVKKILQVPLSARTVARQIEDMAEDIETQLLQLIVTSPWFAIQYDESNDIENKAMLLVFVRYLYIFNLDIHDDMLCALLLSKNTTASKLFKSMNDYFAEKLNWSSCAGMCKDEAAAMIGRLSGLTVRIKEVAPECEAIRCVIHKEMLARRKISPKLNNVFDDMLKLKLISLTTGCLSRYVWTWIQSTITFLHTKVR